MAEKTRGIVLRALKYDDQSLIVDMFTEQSGVVPFLVRLPRSRKATVRAVQFRPLTLLQLDYDYRQRAVLQRLRDVQIGYVYTSLPYEPVKAGIALFLAEFLYYALRREAANPLLYAYLDHSLQWLDRCNGDMANFHLVFITRLTRFLGFYPNVESYCGGDYFDLQNGCFTALRPCHNACLEPEEAALVPLLIRMRYATMDRFVLNRHHRNRYLEVLNAYYRLHIPDFPDLKSLGVLSQVFGG